MKVRVRSRGWPELLRAPVVFVLLVDAVYNCHLLRNVTPVYYAALGTAFVAATVYALSQMGRLPITPIGGWLLAYLLFGLYAATQTLVDLGPAAAGYGAARFLMTYPLAAAVFLVSAYYPRVFEYALWMFLVFAVIGVLSIVLQYFTGPISWFVEASDRAGMERFGSFLGSIPTIGAVVPIGILLVLLMPMSPPVRVTLLLTLGAGIFASLSKQAASGSLLSLVLGLTLGRKKRFSVIAWILIVGALGYFVMDALDIPLIDSMKNYVTGILFPEMAGSASMRGYDYHVRESMWLRMTELPMNSYAWLLEHRGSAGPIIGGGYVMLGLSLLRPGDSTYFTAHNNYMDFVLLGGAGFLITYLGLCISVTRESWRLYRNRSTSGVGGVMLGIGLMYVTASMFTGGLTYQPALATLWWIYVGFAWRIEANRGMAAARPRRRPPPMRVRYKPAYQLETVSR